MADDRQLLANRLMTLAAERRATLPEIYDGVLDKVVEHLREVGLADGALKVGDELPPFLLLNDRAELVSSDELLAQGPLVVSFYRGDWCPFCLLTLKALAESHAEIAAAGGQFVAVTPDLIPATAQTSETLSLPFPVLSDLDSAFGLQCGVIYRMPDAMIEVYRRHDLARRHGGDQFFLPIPAVYVVDQGGIIRHAYLDPDFTRRLEPAQIVQALNAITQADHAT